MDPAADLGRRDDVLAHNLRAALSLVLTHEPEEEQTEEEKHLDRVARARRYGDMVRAMR